MAVQSQQQPSPAAIPTAQVVGNAFVHQYYHILHQSPELVYRFYNENSKLGRPEADGLMSSVTTMQAINEKILSLGYGDFTAEIKSVDSQDSLNGGVLVLVTGYLTGSDSVRRNFTQSFFLAPQDKGYFVLNDIFRYMEDVEYPKDDQGLPNGMVAPMEPQQDTAPAEEHIVSEQTAISSEEDITVEEVYNPSENGDGSVVEEEPTAEVVTEAQNNGQMVADTSSVVVEEMPKKSYAFIVKVMKENPAPVSAPILVSSPAKPSPAKVEKQVAPAPAPAPAPAVAPAPTPAPSSAPAPDTVQNSDIPLSNLNGTENGNAQETEADGHSIYIRGLPMNATPPQLEEEFKRFGPIKSGGIQVRSNKQQGFCFGFVEFEVAAAVQSAIEASPITIGGRQAYVELKRATSSRVNNSRGRFPSGRGGGNFRNDGARGRGNYGNSRNYGGRGDFSNNNRGDFVNNRIPARGGATRSGDGGYQRFDHVGSNGGGRMNRAGGFGVNGVAKSVAPRVPVPA